MRGWRKRECFIKFKYLKMQGKKPMTQVEKNKGSSGSDGRKVQTHEGEEQPAQGGGD